MFYSQNQHCAVIAEYNPFHNGHAYHLAQTKARTGGALVAVMSGHFVQRGEPALLSKWARAEMALKNGANLVIELPLPWAMATAERFAAGGISLIHALGCVGAVSFGSESGDLSPLLDTARMLETPELNQAIRARLPSGESFARLRERAVEALGVDPSPLSRPNDTLAVEYLRALHRLDAPIQPFCVARTGAAHDSAEAVQGICSASHIRKHLDTLELSAYMPQTAADILRCEMESGRAPSSLAHMERAVLAVLRRMTAEDLSAAADVNVSEGLHNRLYRAIWESNSLEDILTAAKTKRYPLARLRRILMSAYLGIPADWAKRQPPYLRVLGMSKTGRTLLAQARKTASLPIILRYADIKQAGSFAREVFELECRATALYGLSLPQIKSCTEEMVHPVIQV